MLTNYGYTSIHTVSIILLMLSIDHAVSDNYTITNITSNPQLDTDHENFNFQEYISKYNPSKVWEEMDKKKKYDGVQMTDQEQLDMMFNSVDQTDDLFNFRISPTIHEPNPKNTRRFGWFPPPEHSKLWYDPFFTRNRLYDLMRQLIYQTRSKMIVMQIYREKYRPSALYKMGFLTNKADLAVKLFAKVSYHSYWTCMASRVGVAMRTSMGEIVEFNRRQLNLWMDVQVLSELIAKNHLIAMEIVKNGTLESKKVFGERWIM